MSDPKKTFYEEIQVRASEALDRIRDLIQQGNVRKLVLKNEKGEVLFEIPLTAGVAVAGVFTLVAPVLAAVGAALAFLTKVTIEVHRRDGGEGGGTGD